jgi:nicotinate-nucleotide--dimethylbenzimidazole phosphoribosyltransferase
MYSQAFEQRLHTATGVLDNKTKPPGSLGLLEAVAAQLSAIQHSVSPTPDPVRAIIFAGDHGIVQEGVSAYPQEVTRQMLLNFAAGGAAINALCNAHNIALEVINTGVIGDPVDGTVTAKIADGTANMLNAPAMSAAQLDQALDAGKEAVQRAQHDRVKLLAVGEMGIGNTTSAAAIVAALCNADGNTTAGRGTGLNDQALANKAQIVNKILSTHRTTDATEVLRCMGGFEIAALTGAMLQAAETDIAVIVDGYITTAAALCAVTINPKVREHLIFAHQSAEPGHQLALAQLNATPLLQFNMRLGEGSGAALAVPLLRSACAIINDMATFEDAGVSDKNE